jgi:hypothetical protein
MRHNKRVDGVRIAVRLDGLGKPVDHQQCHRKTSLIFPKLTAKIFMSPRCLDKMSLSVSLSAAIEELGKVYRSIIGKTYAIKNSLLAYVIYRR